MSTFRFPISVKRLAALLCGAALSGLAVDVPAAGGQPAAAERATRAEAARPRPGTVTVVPFVNLSRDPADAALGEGLAETVIAGLDAVQGLTVVVRSPHAAAQQPRPDVAWLVTGGFQRRGRQLRVTARIASAQTGVVLRTIRIDGTLDELFALQDRVVAALRERFAGLNGGASPPSPAAAETLPGAGDAAQPDLERSAPRRRRGGAFGAAPAPGAAAPATGPPEYPESRTRVGEPPPPPAVVPVPAALPEPEVEASGVLPGVLAIDDDAPRFGVASGAGILTGRPTVRPPRTPTPPTIDGRLDDAAWSRAVRITEFVQLAPRAGEAATQDSDVYIAYDSANLYIGFYAHFTDPQLLRANRKDRDVRTGDDVFWVYIDPFLDQQRAYSFGVNAYGVQMDTIVSTRGGGGFGGGGGRGGPGLRLPFGDSSWDTLFDSAGRIVTDGFTAEIAIPFKSLRYPQRTGNVSHQWGFQIARRIRAGNETVVWAPVTREIAGFLPQMGVLQGMTGLSTSRNIEILPTFTAVQFGRLDDAGSFVNDDAQPEGGVNFKYGVTSNLTADVTFNPDFSQIESDRPQIEVNQRFNLFYPELRPFFLEGAEIFNVRAPVRIVHTRTIIDPRYGAKLTGKAGKTTLGVMYANDEAPGYAEDAVAGAAGQTAQTFVGRVRYDLYSESYIGATFTDREFLDGYSRLAGVDSNFRLGDTHEVGFRAFGTQHRDLDGVETSGHLLNANIRKSGRNLRYFVAAYSLSPDFKTDVGFVRRTDQRWMFTELAYRWWPESWLVSWGPRVRYTRGYDFNGSLEDQQATVGVNLAFADSINFNANVDRAMERFGGINFFKTRYRFFSIVSRIRQFSFGLGGNGGDQIFFDEEHPYLGRDRGWSTFINLRLIPQLESRSSIDTNRFVDVYNDALVFDVNIFRTLTTFQFTDRFLLRNISEYNSFDQRLSLNFLLTYRVNAGTAFYAGYDDHYLQADHITRDLDGNGIDDRIFQSTALKRTNRAVFVKLQYLFRY